MHFGAVFNRETVTIFPLNFRYWKIMNNLLRDWKEENVIINPSLPYYYGILWFQLIEKKEQTQKLQEEYWGEICNFRSRIVNYLNTQFDYFIV